MATIAKNETTIVGNYLEAKKTAEESQYARSLLRAKRKKESAFLRAKRKKESAFLRVTSAKALIAIAQIGEGLRE